MMINVIVSYTVPEDFIEINKTNIQKFLGDFEQLNASEFSYRVLQKENEPGFVHISNYANPEIQQQLLAVPSFVEFQKQRDSSCEDIKQKIEIYQFIGSSGKL